MNCWRRPIDCLLRKKIAPLVIDVDVSILTNCFHQSSCILDVVFSHDYWRLSGIVRALMSIIELCRLPTVFHIIWKAVCLTVPFRSIIQWSVVALGSALPSTIYSNHALLNLRTAWQYSQMSYRMLHYIDIVHAFTYLLNKLIKHNCRFQI